MPRTVTARSWEAGRSTTRRLHIGALSTRELIIDLSGVHTCAAGWFGLLTRRRARRLVEGCRVELLNPPAALGALDYATLSRSDHGVLVKEVIDRALISAGLAEPGPHALDQSAVGVLTAPAALHGPRVVVVRAAIAGTAQVSTGGTPTCVVNADDQRIGIGQAHGGPPPQTTATLR